LDFGADQPPAATLVATNGADITSGQIASFVFLQRGLNNTNQPGTAIVDELRIGPTWASVTPPGALPPVLNAALVGSELVLSWPASASGFVLEAAPDLTSTSIWAAVSETINVAGDQFIVTNDTAAAKSFYRLRKAQ